MKLWVNDYRDAPDDTWHEVRNVTEAIRVLYSMSTEVTDISLDHDIEHSTETFMPVAMYIGLIHNDSVLAIWGLSWKPKITIHSINTVGAKSMKDVLEEYGMEATLTPHII